MGKMSGLTCNAHNFSGLLVPVRFGVQYSAAPICEKAWLWLRQSMKLAGATGLRPLLRITTRRLSSLYGSGRSNTALTTLNMAVFAPIPRARVMTATAVNPGFLRSVRIAYLRLRRRASMISLLVAQRHHGIHFGRASCRNICRKQSYPQHRHSAGDDRDGASHLQLGQQARRKPLAPVG